MEILLYLILLIGSVLLYVLKKDTFILNQYYSVVAIPILFSVGWLASTLSIEKEWIIQLTMLGLTSPFLFLFVIGRKRLAKEGKLTCEICGKKLKSIKNDHPLKMDNYQIEPCENCF